MPPAVSSISPVQGYERTWSDLRAVNLLRWAICVLLLALAAMEEPQRMVTGVIPELLAPVAVLFLLSASLFTLMLWLRQPALGTQIFLQAWIDLIVLITLVYVTGGVDGGLSVLLLTAVIAMCTLLPRHVAMSLIAFAIVALMLEEFLREFTGLSPGSDFTRTGLLSALMLLGGFASNSLARRMRESAALAEQKLLDLANLEQLNERILQHMAAGVLVIDRGGRIRQINEAARKQLGADGRQLHDTLASICPELAQSLRQWRRQAEAEGDGPLIRVGQRELQPHFLHLGEYEPAATLIFLEDMDVVHHRVQQIKQAALGRLTASIAHEIRNPLSAITHASQLLGEWRNAPLEEARLLKIIDKHCSRIDRIIDDVLSLSRRRDIQPSSIALRAWLDDLAAEYLRQHPDSDLRLDFSRVPEDLRIRFDPLHLQQIITNLWDNARRYARPPGEKLPTVEHRAWHLPNLNTTHMDVRDNGPGIPAEKINQVFEPFFTSESSGTGLGLYIARELCECNHAHIELRQEAGLGACFQISFMETWQQAPL